MSVIDGGYAVARRFPFPFLARRLATARRGIGLTLLLTALGCDSSADAASVEQSPRATRSGSAVRLEAEQEQRTAAYSMSMAGEGSERSAGATVATTRTEAEGGAGSGSLAASSTFAVQLTHDAQGVPFADLSRVTAELPADHPPAEPREFQPVEDPKGRLVPFYEALGRTDAKRAGAITRVTHLGDSSIGHDGLPHSIRTRMQDRFGDGGAGFLLIDRAAINTNYSSKVASMTTTSAWEACFITNLCKRDGRYGLGGHTFWASGEASSTISTRTDGAYGTTASHLELWYLAQPRGGRIKLKVDRQEAELIPTLADAPEDRWHVVDLEPGAHRITVSAAGGGQARAYGLVLETDGPGVVWESVSMIGAFTKRLNGFDTDHIAGQVAHRNADLLVLNFGGNDLRRMVANSVTPQEYEQEYGEALDRLKARRPTQPCLVVGVIDHGRSGSYTVEPEVVDSMIDTQRKIAFDHGCAFFDTVTAMGGAGSLRKWRERSPSLAEPDLKHLNNRGRDLMGKLMYQALVAGYESYRHRPGHTAP
jgi:GDSL-like Lipase/Acylhydrolase family